MNKVGNRLGAGLWMPLLFLAFLLPGCRSVHYRVTEAEGGRITVDAKWDGRGTAADAEELVAHYRARVDSLMNRPLGTAAETMDRERPEDLLSNLVADVLREAAADVLGRPADVGLMNVGGLRSVLSAGTITLGTAYEILPFENSLCVLTLKGDALRRLFGNVAARHGEGISGASLEISPDGRLLQAAVAGEPVDDGRLYTVATIDYLAEGNDGMTALTEARERICPDGATLRSLFVRYVEARTAAGEEVTSRREGRIVVRE